MADVPQKIMRGKRVILYPLPFQGHLNPMLQLASILSSNGFSITIVHNKFNSPNPSNYPAFSFHSIPDGSLQGFKDVIASLKLLNVECVVPFRNLLSKPLLDEEPVACLITDANWHFTQAVADELKLPRLVLRTSNLSSFMGFVALPLLKDKDYLPIKDSELQVHVVGFLPLRVKDLPEIETANPEDVYKHMACVVDKIKVSSGLIWNSFEELEHDALITCSQEFPVPVFTIGPFHKYFPASSSSLQVQDQSCISWLDKQAPSSVLYVSFGSIAAVSETEFLEIAWGLANSDQPFLWVVRPGLVCGSSELPRGFIEKVIMNRGHIIKWAPQHEVLAHPAVGGFWTHNGWNSKLESICEGIPMICKPSFGDQRMIARYVSDVWRIGVHLEYKLDRRNIEESIRKLMADPGIRVRALWLKEKVDRCLKPGGSSFQALESLLNYISLF